MNQYRILRQLMLMATAGALAGTGCFVADDKDSDDDAGQAGEDSGGTSSAGAFGNGGNSGTGSPSGGTPSTGGTGSPSGGTPSTGGTGTAGGTAVMKFCNVLTKNDADVVLTVNFGGVRLSTITGTCTPPVPQTCTTIPTGEEIPVSLLDGTTSLWTGTFSLVEAGDEILTIAEVDDATMTMPSLSGGTFAAGYACSTTDPLAVALEAQSQRFDFTEHKTFRLSQSAQVLGPDSRALRALGYARAQSK